jgi:hypothetical protein
MKKIQVGGTGALACAVRWAVAGTGWVLSGCGPEAFEVSDSESGAEDSYADAIQTQTEALVVTNEFSSLTPSVHCQAEFGNCMMAFTLGQGTHEKALYQLNNDADEGWAPGGIELQAAFSNDRPFMWWSDAHFINEVLYRDASSGLVFDAHEGEVTDIPLASGSPVGPITAEELYISTFDGEWNCAWWRNSQSKIVESCVIEDALGQPWSSWDVPDQIFQATTSPIAITKKWCSPDVTSLFYGCATAHQPTRVCELRLDSDIAVPAVGQYATSFGTTGTTLHAGTRPTAASLTWSGDFLFATVVNGSTRTVRSLKGITACSGTPTFTTYDIETQSGSENYRFSTPMPYLRSDGRLSVVYFRTQENPQANTEIRQAIWSEQSWSWTVSTIYNTGVEIPEGGGEPVPYATTYSGHVYNALSYRVPDASGFFDVVELEEVGTAWNTKVRKIFDGSYVTFDANSTLARFDEVTKLPTEGSDPAWQISNGTLFEASNVAGSGGSNLTGSTLYYSDAVVADGWVQAKLSSTDDDFQGLVLRAQGPNHFYLFEVSEPNWAIKRWAGGDNGTVTTLASGTHNIDWATPRILRFDATGNFLAAYIDGVKKAELVDTAYRSGRVGLHKRGQLNATYDNFYVLNGSHRTSTTQIKTDRDAILRGGASAGTNFGTTTAWEAMGPTQLDNARKLGMSFPLSSIGTKPVVAASLNIIGFTANTDTADKTIRVYGLKQSQNQDGWSQSSVTWNNFPGNSNTATAADTTKMTLLGTMTVEHQQDDGNNLLSFRGQALVDFLNQDTDDRVTFLLTADSRVKISTIATKERATDCKIQGTTAGACTPTLDITQ